MDRHPKACSYSDDPIEASLGEETTLGHQIFGPNIFSSVEQEEEKSKQEIEIGILSAINCMI